MNKQEIVLTIKDEVLKLERESLSNVVQTEDKQMIAKIMKTYEEHKNDN